MRALLSRLWRRLRRAEPGDGLPGIDDAIDTTPPADVEPLAKLLWAMCWDKPGRTWHDYSLPAVVWLNYGLLRLPPGSAPLQDEVLAALPVPYGQRSDVTS